jgi:hypothetical protein
LAYIKRVILCIGDREVTEEEAIARVEYLCEQAYKNALSQDQDVSETN